MVISTSRLKNLIVKAVNNGCLFSFSKANNKKTLEKNKIIDDLSKKTIRIDIDVTPKPRRYWTLGKAFRSFINSRTIIDGACRKWNAPRLLIGRHQYLDKLGAEHLQLHNKLGDTVDATYLNAATLVEKLEELGGERAVFKLNDDDNHEFKGYFFNKKSPESIEIFEHLAKTGLRWRWVESGDQLFLIKDISGLTESLKRRHQAGTLTIKKTVPLDPKNINQGVVLMSMNATCNYEKFTCEMLYLALEGINVMAYNDIGKGLSTSASLTPGTSDHINESIETCYSYLTKIKKIPDNKILAKGQCGGSAATAWLGKEHPDINLMLDQAPASFTDAAEQVIHNELGMKKTGLWSKFCRLTRLDNLVNWIAKSVIYNYDTPTNLKSNKGHVLFHNNLVNTPSTRSLGGDEMVTNVQMSTLDTSVLDRTKVNHSFKMGGSHTDNWYSSDNSNQSVLSFMKKLEIVTNFFNTNQDS